MSIEELKPLLCEDSKGDICACISCEKVCPFGKRVTELLEKETKGSTKQMNRKQICDAIKRIEAMENYIEAMSDKNPVAFVQQKYGIPLERTAKNKIYQWQHNYGTNISSIRNKVLEIKAEIAASQVNVDKQTSTTKQKEITEIIPVIPVDEKKLTKRQEEKISKHRLEQMREDLEKEYLGLEKEIKEHKKEIDECEKRIAAIVEETNAIRAVLDIFKKKDEMYV
jgi:hypothetical protein